MNCVIENQAALKYPQGYKLRSQTITRVGTLDELAKEAMLNVEGWAVVVKRSIDIRPDGGSIDLVTDPELFTRSRRFTRPTYGFVPQIYDPQVRIVFEEQSTVFHKGNFHHSLKLEGTNFTARYVLNVVLIDPISKALAA